MAWNEDYPKPGTNDRGSDWVIVIVLLIIIVAIASNNNTTSEQVSETDVEQVSETNTGQDYEPAPEENYEPIPETKYIIKRFNGGWFQCDVNDTNNWTLNLEDGTSYNCILETEYDSFYHLRSIDDNTLWYSIPKDFGMSYYNTDVSTHPFVEYKYIYDGNY
jgi:hypothetical protein